MHIIMYHPEDDHTRLGDFLIYLAKSGHRTQVLWNKHIKNTTRAFTKHVRDVDFVFMWTGRGGHCTALRKFCADHGISSGVIGPSLIDPQCLTLDTTGVGPDSDLGQPPPNIVLNVHYKVLENIRGMQRKSRPREPQGYVLFSLPSREELLLNYKGLDTAGCVAAVADRFKGLHLVVWTADPGSSPGIDTVSGEWLDHVRCAGLVYGVENAQLYAAALYGAPVMVEGPGLLRTHAHNPDWLMAAAISRHIPENAKDFSQHLSLVFGKSTFS